jgi:hypothetical protein
MGKQMRLWLIWVVVTIALLLWNSAYCVRTFVPAFKRGDRLAILSGLVALVGALSAMAFIALVFLFARDL